jgi:hypothetical protein
MLKVALCLIATGKYKRFVPDLLEDVALRFCCDFDVRVHLWTDSACTLAPPGLDVKRYPWDWEPWPGSSLHRYRALSQCDPGDSTHVYYMDVDTRIQAFVGDDIIGNIVAVEHPDYKHCSPVLLPLERNPQAQCFVDARETNRYYTPSFQGGRTDIFMRNVQMMRGWIDHDENCNVMTQSCAGAAWNKILVRSPPTLRLSPSYYYCAKPPVPKIVSVPKDHLLMRAP